MGKKINLLLWVKIFLIKLMLKEPQVKFLLSEWSHQGIQISLGDRWTAGFLCWERENTISKIMFTCL